METEEKITYLISPLYAANPKRAVRGFNDWQLKVFTPDQSVVKTYRVERYIDALRLVQMLQLHLKQADKLFAA